MIPQRSASSSASSSCKSDHQYSIRSSAICAALTSWSDAEPGDAVMIGLVLVYLDKRECEPLMIWLAVRRTRWRGFSASSVGSEEMRPSLSTKVYCLPL